MCSKQRNIINAVPQGNCLDGKYIQTKEQVLAESFCINVSFQTRMPNQALHQKNRQEKRLKRFLSLRQNDWRVTAPIYLQPCD